MFSQNRKPQTPNFQDSSIFPDCAGKGLQPLGSSIPGHCCHLMLMARTLQENFGRRMIILLLEMLFVQVNDAPSPGTNLMDNWEQWEHPSRDAGQPAVILAKKLQGNHPPAPHSQDFSPAGAAPPALCLPAGER